MDRISNEGQPVQSQAGEPVKDANVQSVLERVNEWRLSLHETALVANEAGSSSDTSERRCVVLRQAPPSTQGSLEETLQALQCELKSTADDTEEEAAVGELTASVSGVDTIMGSLQNFLSAFHLSRGISSGRIYPGRRER